MYEVMRQLLRLFSSYIAMSSYEVKHNVKGREFYIALEKGKLIYSRMAYKVAVVKTNVE